MKDFDLDHVDISFSNKGLWPWEGGCLWEKDGEKPLIQLRKVFLKKERYLWFYTRSEILAHEAVHAKRLGYKEPIFEEILAYQTSPNRFRRFFGPMFRSSKETIFFILASFMAFLSPLPFLVLLAMYLTRLVKYQSIFLKLKKMALKKFGCPKVAFSHLVLLKDAEILKIVKKMNF